MKLPQKGNRKNMNFNLVCLSERPVRHDDPDRPRGPRPQFQLPTWEFDKNTGEPLRFHKFPPDVER